MAWLSHGLLHGLEGIFSLFHFTDTVGELIGCEPVVEDHPVSDIDSQVTAILELW